MTKEEFLQKLAELTAEFQNTEEEKVDFQEIDRLLDKIESEHESVRSAMSDAEDWIRAVRNELPSDIW